MNKLILVLTLVVGLFAFSPKDTLAVRRVSGYFKPSTGSYVMPYYRSNTNSYKFDNYSSKGNYNPFTGKKGYKSWY